MANQVSLKFDEHGSVDFISLEGGATIFVGEPESSCDGSSTKHEEIPGKSRKFFQRCYEVLVGMVQKLLKNKCLWNIILGTLGVFWSCAIMRIFF